MTSIRTLKRYQHLYLMLVLPVAFYVIFRYIPMGGVSLAFRSFVPGGSMFGERFVGFKYFKIFLKDEVFWRAFRNTLVISVVGLGVGFPLPIIFALLLNELKGKKFKKTIQTISYLPKFLSTIVVVGIIRQLLSPSAGIVNEVITYFGGEAIHFLNEPGWFKPIYIISDVWQFMGWNAILYIAALTNTDPQLYEAAQIDGANRWKQTLHITLPGIKPIIVITLILSIGQMINIGFEKVLLLYNPMTYSSADVIQSMVYRIGVGNNNYSYGTAIGLFQGLISIFLITTANRLAKKFTETSLW